MHHYLVRLSRDFPVPFHGEATRTYAAGHTYALKEPLARDVVAAGAGVATQARPGVDDADADSLLEAINALHPDAA